MKNFKIFFISLMVGLFIIGCGPSYEKDEEPIIKLFSDVYDKCMKEINKKEVCYFSGIAELAWNDYTKEQVKKTLDKEYPDVLTTEFTLDHIEGSVSYLTNYVAPADSNKREFTYGTVRCEPALTLLRGASEYHAETCQEAYLILTDQSSPY